MKLSDFQITLPPKDIPSYINPHEVLIDDKMTGKSLAGLLYEGYALLEQLRTIEAINPRIQTDDEKDEWLKLKQSLNLFSRRIIYIYQKCVSSDDIQADIGAKASAAFIIRLMEPDITRYLQMFHLGYIDILSQDTRNFLILYANINNTGDYNLITKVKESRFKKVLSSDVFNYYRKVADGLKKKFFYMSIDEKYNQLCTLILEIALKYNTDLTIAFWIHVRGGYSNPKVKMMGRLKYALKDYVAKQSGYFMYDPGADLDERNVEDTNILDPEESLMGERVELSADWIEGKGDIFEYPNIFAPLNKRQRQIIIQYFNEKQNLTAISRTLGISRSDCMDYLESAIDHMMSVIHMPTSGE